MIYRVSVRFEGQPPHREVDCAPLKCATDCLVQFARGLLAKGWRLASATPSDTVPMSNVFVHPTLPPAEIRIEELPQ